MMDRKRVSIGTSHLDLVDIGNGPAILFVHGFPLDHSMWQFQIEHLSNRFRILCPDLAGFGTSPSSRDSPTLRGYADELVAMLDNLDIKEPVCYCGLSMGGYIGWQFWKHYPKRVSRLVACDTRAAKDTEQVRRARKIAAKSVFNTGSEPVADAMVEKLFHQSDSGQKRDMTSSVHRVISQTEPDSIAAGQLAMSERPDATPWLADIKIPTLFVVGEFDEITTPEEMRENAAGVQDSNFVEIPDAGHMAPLENHKEFNQSLVEFMLDE